MSDIEIRGGVGPVEAAVIAVAVRHALDTEAAQRAQPVSRPDLSAWIMASRVSWPSIPEQPSAGQPLGLYSRPLVS